MKQAFTTCLTESVSTWRRREIILALEESALTNLMFRARSGNDRNYIIIVQSGASNIF